jgi:hypothetical protein
LLELGIKEDEQVFGERAFGAAGALRFEIPRGADDQPTASSAVLACFPKVC